MQGASGFILTTPAFFTVGCRPTLGDHDDETDSGTGWEDEGEPNGEFEK
jgi:hypothetical protein